LVVAACVLFAVRATGEPAGERGTFALLGGTQKIDSEAWTGDAGGTALKLDIRQFALGGTTPVLNYDLEMERLMHLIVVRDDFATFAHLHPAFDPKTGTFELSVPSERSHRYFVYADTTPQEVGQQVFRFTIASNGTLETQAAPPASTGESASAPSVNVNPYLVTLGRTTLNANQPQRVDLTIQEGGRPATDLGTYLGAAAHAVFINTATLAYVHVHPMPRGSAPNMGADMQMNDAQPSPLLQLDAPALPAGAYKLWVEFRGAKNAVYTAPFTILAR
jgi:hypothetical protein